MSTDSTKSEAETLSGWYELFSRGSRDWLRHNEKIREAVRAHLPQIVSGSDIINDGSRTVRVPVRMLEHYRFRLLSTGEGQGVGQGKAKPGDLLGQAGPGSGPDSRPLGFGSEGSPRSRPGSRCRGSGSHRPGLRPVLPGKGAFWRRRPRPPAQWSHAPSFGHRPGDP